MLLYSEREFIEYITRNYECILETVQNPGSIDGISSYCESCSRDVFLKRHSDGFHHVKFDDLDLKIFVIFFCECPKCLRKSFIFTVQVPKTIRIEDSIPGKDRVIYYNQYYKLYSLPASEESYLNKDIPEEHVSLKDTVSEALFCLSHSRNIASAILFRRAIQILAKDILGATGSSLHKQLQWLTTNPNKLSVDLTDVFHHNAKIIKDIGNQGAHPDDDETLHKFTKEDANGLHDLFISIIHEVYVKPAKMKELQDSLKKSRKLN